MSVVPNFVGGGEIAFPVLNNYGGDSNWKASSSVSMPHERVRVHRLALSSGSSREIRRDGGARMGLVDERLTRGTTEVSDGSGVLLAYELIQGTLISFSYFRFFVENCCFFECFS